MSLILPTMLVLLDEEILYDNIDCHTSFKARNDQYVRNYQTKLWPEIGAWDVTITFVKLPRTGSRLVIHYSYVASANNEAYWIERTMDGVSDRVKVTIPKIRRST